MVLPFCRKTICSSDRLLKLQISSSCILTLPVSPWQWASSSSLLSKQVSFLKALRCVSKLNSHLEESLAAHFGRFPERYLLWLTSIVWTLSKNSHPNSSVDHVLGGEKTKGTTLKLQQKPENATCWINLSLYSGLHNLLDGICSNRDMFNSSFLHNGRAVILFGVRIDSKFPKGTPSSQRIYIYALFFIDSITALEVIKREKKLKLVKKKLLWIRFSFSSHSSHFSDRTQILCITLLQPA